MKRRNRKRKNPSPFNFAKLEPRQLLAGDLGELNLLTNGDFEQVPAAGPVPNFFDSADVAGWNATNAAAGQQIVLYTFGTGEDANTVLKLDSLDDQIDHVFQDVATETNTEYTLTFDLRGQIPNNDVVIVENVEVFWNDELVGTFESGGIWTTHAIVVNGIAGNSQLEFREQGGDGNDGLGVLIDNVNLAVATDSQGVTNGSFETVTGDGPFYSNGNVEGWEAIDTGDRPDLIQIQPNGDNPNANATDGTNVLNLDTTNEVVDHVYSDFATTAGQMYFVMFDMFADGDQTTVADRDEVRVRWKTPDSEILSNQWIATIIGNNSWQSFGFMVEGLGDFSRLELREPGNQPGDGSGALIDNVRLFEIAGAVNDLVVDANGGENGTSATAVLQQGATSVNIASDLTLTHNNGSNLTDATVTITESTAQTEDELSIVPGVSGITQSYDSTTGTLSLVGNASVATWQSVLRTLQYQNTDSSPTVGNRRISIVVSDDSIIGGTQDSAAAIIDVNVVANQLSIAAIADQTVEAGSPLWVALEVDNPADVAIQYSGETADASILTPRFESGDSWRLNISAPDAETDGVSTPLSGELTFQLFEDIFGSEGSRATDRIRTLTNDGFYDGIVFHRIARSDVAFQGDNAGDPFVIQGGDPTATGSGGSDLGDFDDQFSTLLQHNRSGLLSYAKSFDDTNDSQFFVTASPTRFLDYNHTIFGVITSGEELREDINAVDTNGQTPTGAVTITSAEIYQDNQRAGLLLVAPEGVTGQTTVTITARDANGNETTQTVNVNVVAPTESTSDSNPFLDDIPDLQGNYGVQGTFQLTAQDVENDSVRYLDLEQIETINDGLATNFQFPEIEFSPFQGDSSFEYSVDIDTGLVTFTPGSADESPETVQFLVGVAQEPRAGEPINNSNVDLQVVTITLSEA